MSIVDDIRVLLFSKSELPQCTGPHSVGTTRLKVRPPADGGRRAPSITVQLWYPIEKAAKEAPRIFGFAWLTRLRHLTWASARHGAPLVLGPAKLPFITYVPDVEGRHDENTFTLANLASHGFILAAIHDPFRNAALDTTKMHRADEAADPLSVHCAQRIRCGVKTASALLDGLEALAPNGPGGSWAERLDLRQVGILGYALGGAVAAQSTHADPRYVVAANLDGTPCGQEQLVETPYLLMLSDFSMPANGSAAKDETSEVQFEPPLKVGAYRRAQHQASLPRSHVIEVAHTDRQHFSDRLVFPSMFASARRRLPNFKRIRAIIDSYTVAFFSTYLQSTPHPLMCVRHSPYAEVRFIYFPSEYATWLHGEPAGHG